MQLNRGKFWSPSISEVLETDILMYSATSEGTFIYEDGNEKLLAAEICECLDTSVQCRLRLRCGN
jgi:hypothetical protein